VLLFLYGVIFILEIDAKAVVAQLNCSAIGLSRSLAVRYIIDCLDPTFRFRS
jgi:hypothetical protein